MNIAIIGAGLIGHRRAKNLPKAVRLQLICDIDPLRAQKFAGEFSCKFTTDWHRTVNDKDMDALIISTTNNMLSEIAAAAIANGKHVLVEKPAAQNVSDFQKVIKAYKKNQVVFMTGYNHRYHPAIMKAKQIIETGKFGPVLFIRSRYGHGGRLGYEKEWRFDPEIAGGGELLDQGSHLIDLVNFFAGPMEQVAGFTANLFWKSKLEDASFFTLKNGKNQFAQLCATAVEWKNIFDFEIMLKSAKIHICGLGGSYGTETLTLYKMKPEMGPPDVEKFEFPGEDLSWKTENELFFHRIKTNNTSDAGILQAKYVLETIEKIYKQNL